MYSAQLLKVMIVCLQATGSEVPLVVRSCVKAIEQYGGKLTTVSNYSATHRMNIRLGMTMEGLFRVPGPAAYTDELRKGFEEG